MRERCAIIFCVCLGVAVAAPSVFQRNGLQREQESALRREPFDPLSPFHQISPSNVQTGNTLVVPPTVDVDAAYSKPAGSDADGPTRTFMNHFEILNKDALVGLLIEKDIPFYVKTIVEPQKPVQTKIHVMRIPKKYEVTSALPDVNLNLVELINNDTDVNEKGSYNTDAFKQVRMQIEDQYAKKGHMVSVVQNGNNEIVKVTERRPEDASTEQEAPLLSVTDSVGSTDVKEMQGDDPNVASTTAVYQHAVIYTPEKRPDHKSLWDQIGDAYDKAKDNIGDAYDKAKDKTKEYAGKAKEKIDPLLDKAKEKAKDVFDSDEKTPVKPEDDI